VIILELDNRKKRILQAIVNEYIDTIEPVSSNSIITKYDINCSSATVRNEMAELEKEGFLEKTHTSSGRVPSNKGYRFYVDKLLNDKDLDLSEIKYINSKLKSKVDEMEELTKIATNTISEVTHYTTVAIEPNAGKQRIQEIKFVLLGSRMLMAVILTEMGTIKETIIKFDKDITQDQVDTISLVFNNKLRGQLLSSINVPMEQYIMQEMNYRLDVIKPIVDQITKVINDESKVYLKGASQALDNPEFRKGELAKQFLNLLDKKELIVDLLDDEHDFNVYIGNEINGLDDLSLITFRNKVKGKDLGTIGILGPTRMDYSKVVSVLKYIRDQLNKDN
jgi:heat-inducible transcriptional repressor